MPHAPEHVCAALPKTHLSMHLVWCEVHAAWTLNQHMYLEDGDAIRDVVPFTAVEFGPFDGADDVIEAFASFLRSTPFRVH